MRVEEAKRLKALEHENTRLKRLLADSMIDNEALKAALAESAEPVKWAHGGDGDERGKLGSRFAALAGL
jgi:hypothetical protein